MHGFTHALRVIAVACQNERAPPKMPRATMYYNVRRFEPAIRYCGLGNQCRMCRRAAHRMKDLNFEVTVTHVCPHHRRALCPDFVGVTTGIRPYARCHLPKPRTRVSKPRCDSDSIMGALNC